MSTPDAIERVFAAWLRAHENAIPSDRDLAALIDALPFPAERRAARLYARGFVRGCEYCTPIERARIGDDLAAIETRLVALTAYVRALRTPLPSPESPG